ncbi:F-box protein AUF2-like [Rutidosis leptorrhynchoides]|uniref:F-box protein AUF2-like n=1 Tax=Rutidosis leptorrhynchoides TaxID=125765 RepID=UPI003A99AD00
MVVYQCEWCKSRDFVNREALLIHLQAETCTSSPSPSSLISTPLQNYYVSQNTAEIDRIMLLLDARLHSLAKPQIAQVAQVTQVEVEQRPVANNKNARRAARRRRQRAARREENNDPFNRLPFEIVLEIINKIMDLKTLCILHLVSKRFSSMVMKANIISLTESKSACTFLDKFTQVKSLCIKFPKSKSIAYDDDECLFKWKIKFSNRFDAFVLLSPVMVYNTNTNTTDGVTYAFGSIKNETTFKLLKHATDRLVYLGDLAKKFPLLEYVCLTDFGRHGMVCVKGREKILQLKNIVSDKIEIKEKLLLYGKKRVRVSCYYSPSLELSGGYIMEAVNMILIERNDLPNDSFKSFFEDDEDNDNLCFEQDKEEAAYHEAMMNVFMNNKNPKRHGFLS